MPEQLAGCDFRRPILRKRQIYGQLRDYVTATNLSGPGMTENLIWVQESQHVAGDGTGAVAVP